MSSIHKVGTVRGYRCAVSGCSKPQKFWPRADNFRQHIKRFHPKVEPDKTMKESLIGPMDAQDAFAHSESINLQPRVSLPIEDISTSDSFIRSNTLGKSSLNELRQPSFTSFKTTSKSTTGKPREDSEDSEESLPQLSTRSLEKNIKSKDPGLKSKRDEITRAGIARSAFSTGTRQEHPQNEDGSFVLGDEVYHISERDKDVSQREKLQVRCKMWDHAGGRRYRLENIQGVMTDFIAE